MCVVGVVPLCTEGVRVSIVIVSVVVVLLTVGTKGIV